MIITPPTDLMSIIYSFFLFTMEFFGNNLPYILMFLGISVFAGFLYLSLTRGITGKTR